VEVDQRGERSLAFRGIDADGQVAARSRDEPVTDGGDVLRCALEVDEGVGGLARLTDGHLLEGRCARLLHLVE
jgi:hypothetical protein